MTSRTHHELTHVNPCPAPGARLYSGGRPDARHRPRRLPRDLHVVKGVLCAPLSYLHAERLALVWMTNPQQGFDRDIMSYPMFRDWRDQSREVFESMAVYSSQPAKLLAGASPEEVRMGAVSEEFFDGRCRPPAWSNLRSRRLRRGTPSRDPARLRVVAARVWRTTDVVGRDAMINGRPYSVVGVLAPGSESHRCGAVDSARDHGGVAGAAGSARRLVAPGDRTTARRRAHRGGTSTNGCRPERAEHRLSRQRSRDQHARHPAARRYGGIGPPAAVAVARRGGAGPAHRLRERLEPVPRAGDGTRARDRDACRTRRRLAAPVARMAQRDAGADHRRRWPDSRWQCGRSVRSSPPHHRRSLALPRCQSTGRSSPRAPR